MRDVSPDSSTIRVTGVIGGYTPEELFDYWVKPDLLTMWWPREATVEAGPGGSYRFEWPDQGWLLQGTYFDFEPGKRLGFTWRWSHDQPDLEPLRVEVGFEPTPEGTALTIEHGPWGASEEDQTERLGVIEGWIHFGMRLAGLHLGGAT